MKSFITFSVGSVIGAIAAFIATGYICMDPQADAQCGLALLLLLPIFSLVFGLISLLIFGPRKIVTLFTFIGLIIGFTIVFFNGPELYFDFVLLAIFIPVILGFAFGYWIENKKIKESVKSVIKRKK